MDALLMCVAPQAALGHAGPGDFVSDGDGRLHRGPGLVYAGAQIIDPRLLDGIGARPFRSTAPGIGQSAAKALWRSVHPGGWCDVGRPTSLPLAEGLLTDVC